jgi:hypothetical protein
VLILTALVCDSALSLTVTDDLVINEVYYDATGTDDHNEYIELYNGRIQTVYLDGAIITDECGLISGTEGVYQFPGVVGGTDYPVYGYQFVLIAVDAIDDGVFPELSGADWEFYQGASDNDNPSVPNLVRVAGDYDIALSNSGDGVVIATGEVIQIPYDCSTVVDGINYETGGGDAATLAQCTGDLVFDSGSGGGNSIGRCPDGRDTNVSSQEDFFELFPTPGYANDCPTAANAGPWGAVKCLMR